MSDLCPLCGADPADAEALRARVAEVERERDAAILRHDEDLGRMQGVVYEALCAAVKDALPDEPLSRIDGAGSDGDEFDFTEAEVSIACGMLTDALDEMRGERDGFRLSLFVLQKAWTEADNRMRVLESEVVLLRSERDEARRERDARPDPGALLAALDAIRAAAATGARPAELARMVEDVQAGTIRPPTGDGELLGGERSCFTCRHAHHDICMLLVTKPAGTPIGAIYAYCAASGVDDADDNMPTNRSIRCPGWAAKEPR